MRWLLNLLKAMLVLVLLLGALAYLLPETHVVQRSRDIAAPPAQVWPWLAEPRRWSRWSPWMASDESAFAQAQGPASGVGAQWRWDSTTQGRGLARVEVAQPASQLVYLLVFEDLGFQATGRFDLQPSAGGTTVQWRIELHAGWNPLLRWFGLGLDALVGPDLDKGLSRLSHTIQP